MTEEQITEFRRDTVLSFNQLQEEINNLKKRIRILECKDEDEIIQPLQYTIPEEQYIEQLQQQRSEIYGETS